MRQVLLEASRSSLSMFNAVLFGDFLQPRKWLMGCKQDDGVIPGRAFTVFCSWLGPQSTGKSSYYQFPLPAEMDLQPPHKKRLILERSWQGCTRKRRLKRSTWISFMKLERVQKDWLSFLWSFWFLVILARHCLIQKCLVRQEGPSWVKAPLAETSTSNVSHFGTWHLRNRSQQCNDLRSWHLLDSTGKRKWIHWQWTGQNLIAVL